MKLTFHILKYLAAIWLFSGSVHAEEPVPYVSNVQLAFTCWNNEFEVAAQGLEASTPIIAPAQARSKQAIYSGPATFTLSQVTRTDEGEVSRQAPTTQITIPIDLKRVLVILIPSSTQPGNLPYRAIVINDDYVAFPLQSLRFLNFTPHKLAGQLGENKFEIMARGEAVSKPLTTQGPKNLVPFRMVRYIEASQTWRPVRSTVFSMAENMRILVIILDDPGELGLRFVMLRGMETNTDEPAPEMPPR